LPRKSPKTLDPRFSTENLKSSKKLNASVGNLYTFYYRGKSSNDPSPLVLNIRRNNQRTFSARPRESASDRKSRKKDKRRRPPLRDYMGGINLNYVSDTIKALLLLQFYRKGVITWRDIVAANKFGKVPYRTYDTSKMRNLKVVSADIYLDEISKIK
jgi:hypothetical protein